MIPRLLLLAFLASPGTALAAGEPAAEAAPQERAADGQEGAPRATDTSIERYRTPLEVLSERMIGETSRAVRFDWRRKTVGLGAIGSQLLELNNFKSSRVGGFARTALGDFLGELAVTWVFTRGSDSTEKLALTPYRQAGRPSRLELDLNLGFPLAEGVATAWPGFFPATELVFSVDAGLRYIYYPGSFSKMGFREVAAAVFSPRLTDPERENLEGDRLPAMDIDAGRYNLLVGFSVDLYFQSGGFLSPRAMIAVPVFSGFSESGLGWWWELSLGLGWMF